jgi:Uncharacterised protein conserved in bacteria (DUF2336)
METVDTSAALLSELDAIEGWSAERCGRILHRVADLFISRADVRTPREIELFDDVLASLARQGDTTSLVKLVRKLADIERSLPKTDRQLVLHASPMVSIPVLRSRRLPKNLLIEAAQSQGQQHLKAIAGRHSLDPSIATVLVQRGDSDVHHTLVRNRGVRLLDSDWSRLVERGESDTDLADQLGRRSDLPDTLKRRVRAKLEDAQMRRLHARPQVMRGQIETTIANTDAAEALCDPDPPNYASSQAKMVELNRKGQLKDSTVNRFAVTYDYTNVIAALAFLSGSSIEVIEPLIVSSDVEGLIIACKACRLNWATTRMIVRNRPGPPQISAEEMERARQTFESLPLSAAQRAVRV